MDQEKRIGKTVHISQLLPAQLQEPVSFDDVELTAEEEQEALNQARMQKTIRLEDERKKALAQHMRTEMLKPWNDQELWQYAKSRGDRMVQLESGNPKAEFKVIDYQVPVIKALSLYFTGDKRFEQLDPMEYNSMKEKEIPFSLNKGLWIWGNPGVGKTLMMQMFRINKRLCYVVVQCPKLTSAYKKFGDEYVDHYSKIMTPEMVGMAKSYDNFFQDQIGVCYNDLGTEPISAAHYKNESNVMQTLFLDTYENKVPWWQRHVTTNLDWKQVEESYTVRVKDRIRQCFNIIEIKGQSLR
jgi:DNA replication protein DnaC